MGRRGNRRFRVRWIRRVVRGSRDELCGCGRDGRVVVVSRVEYCVEIVVVLCIFGWWGVVFGG